MAIAKTLFGTERAERALNDMLRARCQLDAAEIAELNPHIYIEYDVRSRQHQVLVRWRCGDGYRQADCVVDDDVVNDMIAASAMVEHMIERLTENATMRGELFMHRLAQKMPKRIQSVLCYPAPAGDGTPLLPGELLITFRSGTKLRATELETLEPTFVAKCLMVSD